MLLKIVKIVRRKFKGNTANQPYNFALKTKTMPFQLVQNASIGKVVDLLIVKTQGMARNGRGSVSDERLDFDAPFH